IGNFIKINGVMGEVSKIEVFSTHINSLDGRRIIIPNNAMISGNIINYDTNLFRRIKLMLSVSYDSDMKKVISILENIAKTYEGLDKTRENFINTMQYGDSSINILFMVWTPTKGYYKVRGELMSYILEVFNKENIDVPFNILDVNLSENK
ncbi:MAG: mechanosensitive ion channel, partial [Cetobacterium sp.]